jgi:phage FluMu protein Com
MLRQVIDETEQGYVVVKCERCGMDNGMVAYGWAILCSQCKSLDDNEWHEE